MIEIKNATKYFKTDNGKKYILKDVNLIIPGKKNIGILGRNGTGKSTLLRMLGGIDFPTSGEIFSKNSFSWPMGLSGGFQTSMTGLENVKFVCRIYGKNEEEMQSIIGNVKSFSELGDYFTMPIKLYSSGMKSRLSFGLSLAFDFDYIIIDETLSVGDENFKQKSKDALAKKMEKCNVLLVSHSMGILREICDSGIVLDQGKVDYYEDIKDAISHYHRINQPSGVGVSSLNMLYCDDGNTFDNIADAASFYQVLPMSISQALKKNNGSHMFLRKVFYKDENQRPIFQNWMNVQPEVTLISNEGVIFTNTSHADEFYMERTQNKNLYLGHLETVMNDNGFSELLNLKFYYLSEYKCKN